MSGRLIIDLALAPAIALAAWPMRLVRKFPASRIPITFSILRRVGVFPITSHYYEPLFDSSGLRKDRAKRFLPGIDFNLTAQIELLAHFSDIEFLKTLSKSSDQETEFYLENSNFSAGDAEIWYHVIRHFKPRRIIEIGSGHSTKLAMLAINSNQKEDLTYTCDHTCIEPYEMKWLDKIGVKILREKLEAADRSIFSSLEENDILFIDSSHIIRPEGEVLIEFLEILPLLKRGVIVHIHDIFSPRDYPPHWHDHPRFWNEQYLLEAFLSQNNAWQVLLANNLLKHDCYEQMERVCPHLTPAREPGSFYIRRV